MKFYNYDIVFQEIPGEVTLAVNITNCPNHCKNCHSPHLWEDQGEELTPEVVDLLMARYKGLATCICLMGGDGEKPEVEKLAGHIHAKGNMKVGWYSGRNEMPKHAEWFDYVKTGPYKPECGSLKAPTTNQRLYERDGEEWHDITERFRKK